LAFFPAKAADSVWAQEGTFKIVIATPAEGETFYAGASSLLYNVPVTGWIISPDPETVDVQLVLFRDSEQIGSLVTKPHLDGTFKFFVTVNPSASIGNFPAELRSCDSCHHKTELELLPGDLMVRVTATNSTGERVDAERHITVDHSGSATVPVRVVHADNPDEMIANIPVTASTRLYLWRTRHVTALSSGAGFANVPVEALSEASTHYVFRVEPVIVDGTYYESTEAVEVILPPGAIEGLPVTLKVNSETGEISGRVVTELATPLTPISVWAIRLPYGTFYHTQVTENGRFSFPNLPVDTYLVTLDWQTLRGQGLTGTGQRLDLSKNPVVSVELPLSPTDDFTLSGNIQDTNGTPLPFAWVVQQREFRSCIEFNNQRIVLALILLRQVRIDVEALHYTCNTSRVSAGIEVLDESSAGVAFADVSPGIIQRATYRGDNAHTKLLVEG